MTKCLYTCHALKMPRPATGKTPLRTLRADDVTWLPSLARAAEEETSLSAVVDGYLGEWGMGGAAGRDLDYGRWPEARAWAEGRAAALAALRAGLEESLGPVEAEWLAVAAWLAARRFPSDPGHQRRIIAGNILRRAAADPRPLWLEKNRNAARLAKASQEILKRHLPLPEG
jgi:hypothetical protein